jgi:hypothetical protein
MDQQKDGRFVCFAYESISGPEATQEVLKEMGGAEGRESFFEAEIPDEKTVNLARR